MKQIVQDWIEFCENGKDFEDSYFYTLFMEEISQEEIIAIFRSFPNSEELVERLNKFLLIKESNGTTSEKIQELGDLLSQDFLDKKQILQHLPSFSKFNEEYQIVYTRDTDEVEDLILDDIWVQEFHDFMRAQKIITDKKVYELFNALYGITYDADYQLYLFIPLLNTNYTMEHLFRFKKAGGVYAITENEVVYSISN